MKLASKLCRAGLSKKLLYGGIGLAMVGILAACAPASERPGPPVRAPAEEANLKPQYGGSFVMREAAGEPPSLDPRGGGGSAAAHRHSVALIYSGLMRWPFNAVATAAPLVCDLCERWEQTNDTTYIFYLRKGVKWHNKPPLNGRELTAEDVRWALTDGEGYDSKNPLFSSFRNMTLLYGAKVEAVDRYTVKITTKEPSVAFLLALAHHALTYSPKEAVEASRSDRNKDGFLGAGLADTRYVIGSGPFMLKEYILGVGTVMVRNPDYFRKDEDGNQLPYLDEVKALLITDHNVATNALLGGRLHETGVYVTTAAMNKLEKTGRFNFAVGSGGVTPTLHFNADKPPFNDVRVRRAIHLIVDRYEVMVPGGLPYSEVIRWIPSSHQPYGTPMKEVLKLPGYRPDKTQDWEEAKRLLKEAGLEGGFSFTYMASVGQTTLEEGVVIQSQLKPFKIDMKLEPADRAVAEQRQRDGAFDLRAQGGVPAPDPSMNLTQYLTIQAKPVHRWSDPKLDVLIEKQDRIFDPKERAKVMAQIYDILDENLPQVQLYFAPWLRAWDKRFHNLKGDPQVLGQLRWVDIIWMEK